MNNNLFSNISTRHSTWLSWMLFLLLQVLPRIFFLGSECLLVSSVIWKCKKNHKWNNTTQWLVQLKTQHWPIFCYIRKQQRRKIIYFSHKVMSNNYTRERWDGTLDHHFVCSREQEPSSYLKGLSSISFLLQIYWNCFR